MENGPRSQPPSYLELQVSKYMKHLTLPVILMDHSIKKLGADSATTAKELVNDICDKIGLQDRFGFSIFIALYNKVSSLGSGNEHILDAICQCEQYAKELKASEKNAPYRLYLRKECFKPWHDPMEDKISTNLIYQQVTRGIKYEEYRFEDEDELCQVAAERYFIEHKKRGPNDHNHLNEMLKKYLPHFGEGNYSLDFSYHEKVVKALHEVFANERSIDLIKAETVEMARNKWPLLFSFFYEALKISGPNLRRNDVIIALNWTGIFLTDEREDVLLEITYLEVVSVNVIKRANKTPSIEIQLITREEFLFESSNAEEIHEIVQHFLEGLKKKSKYLVTISASREGLNQQDFLRFQKGELLELSSGLTGSDISDKSIFTARNVNSGEIGVVSHDQIYVLPSINRPLPAILQRFDYNPNERSHFSRISRPLNISGEEVQIPHTLEVFAQDNFRQSEKRRSVTLRRYRNVLWAFSKEPIKQPLLKKILQSDYMAESACNMFTVRIFTSFFFCLNIRYRV